MDIQKASGSYSVTKEPLGDALGETGEIPAFVRYVQALKAQYEAKHGPLSAELTAEFITRAREPFGASGVVLNRAARRRLDAQKGRK